MMSPKFQLPLAAAGLALAALLGACASQPRADLASLPGTDACFFTHSIFGWMTLDDSTLIVDAPTSRTPYLVKLMGPLPGLRASERVGFQSGLPQSGMFCSMNSRIFVRSPGVGAPPRYEAVIAVRALTPEQARGMIASAGGPAVHNHPLPQGSDAEASGQPPSPR